MCARVCVGCMLLPRWVAKTLDRPGLGTRTFEASSCEGTQTGGEELALPDGRTDRRTDRQTDRQTHKQTVRQTGSSARALELNSLPTKQSCLQTHRLDVNEYEVDEPWKAREVVPAHHITR